MTDFPLAANSDEKARGLGSFVAGGIEFQFGSLRGDERVELGRKTNPGGN